MPSGLSCSNSLTVVLLASSSLWSVARSLQTAPSPIGNDHHLASRRSNDLSSRAIHDAAFLPAQVGGIVAAYGISLVLVAITLLSLAKRRREHLEADEDPNDTFKDPYKPKVPEGFQDSVNTLPAEGLRAPSISAPIHAHYYGTSPLVPRSTVYPIVLGPGRNPSVDQGVVAADKAMANQQLEDMYRHVMEHEEAKERGQMFDAPYAPAPSQQALSISEKSSGRFFRKGKSKPSSLEIRVDQEDKSQSRASAMFSALLSPKKKSSMRGISISSPIMTPMSASFPHQESQEMNPIPPRNYAPPPPPPIPTDQIAFGATFARAGPAPTPPDPSPESVYSIDERIGLALEPPSRSVSQAASPIDPGSAISEHSQVPLVGLPSSPRLGGRFPSLPQSPKPGATFRRPNPLTAVRANGTLPLRAFEEANGSPSVVGQTTKQTVFERRGPMSPGGGKTPLTANPVPYTPYQPFTPCIPVTPSLVTREDRKRMRRMVPKTPTMTMVQSSDDTW